MGDKDMNEAPVRPGIYARGTETVDAILKAALEVLIEEGAGAFTIRRIAAACGMKVGNVSYHFPKKEMLIQVLLDNILATYNVKVEFRVRQSGLPPEERLRTLIIMCLEDICSKRTTHLFTELWALANHNDFVADRIRAFYDRVHGIIAEHVAELNPALSPEEAETVALFISASMEGTTPFLGHEKPWAGRMPAIIGISTTFFVHLARTVRPEDIGALTSGTR
jgi:AcrR family transcriptional regulator